MRQVCQMTARASLYCANLFNGSPWPAELDSTLDERVWRIVDSVLCSVYPGVDWRTYTMAARPRWAGRIFGCPARVRVSWVGSVIVLLLLFYRLDDSVHQPCQHHDCLDLLAGGEELPDERRWCAQASQWQGQLLGEPPRSAAPHPSLAVARRGG